jgi:hypothetical protein
MSWRAFSVLVLLLLLITHSTDWVSYKEKRLILVHGFGPKSRAASGDGLITDLAQDITWPSQTQTSF